MTTSDSKFEPSKVSSNLAMTEALHPSQPGCPWSLPPPKQRWARQEQLLGQEANPSGKERSKRIVQRRGAETHRTRAENLTLKPLVVGGGVGSENSGEHILGAEMGRDAKEERRKNDKRRERGKQNKQEER